MADGFPCSLVPLPTRAIPSGLTNTHPMHPANLVHTARLRTANLTPWPNAFAFRTRPEAPQELVGPGLTPCSVAVPHSWYIARQASQLKANTVAHSQHLATPNEAQNSNTQHLFCPTTSARRKHLTQACSYARTCQLSHPMYACLSNVVGTSPHLCRLPLMRAEPSRSTHLQNASVFMLQNDKWSHVAVREHSPCGGKGSSCQTPESHADLLRDE